jgi:hypothetical protein
VWIFHWLVVAGEKWRIVIRECGHLGDVSHLANVQTLSLIRFRGNISALQNVVIVDLSYSRNLMDDPSMVK